MVAFPDSSQKDRMKHSDDGDYKDYIESDDSNPDALKFIEFKYILMIITILNFIISIVVEQYIIPYVKKCWMKSQIEKMKHKINTKEKEADLNMINEVKNYALVQNNKKNIKIKNQHQPKNTGFDE
jgi:hypothetical protein